MSSASDEEPEWTAEDEKAFLTTLGALKGENNSIYDNSKRFWNEEKAPSSSKSSKGASDDTKKPMFLKDYERKVVLEKGGIFEESDNEEEDPEAGQPANYFEEQEKIRNQLKAAIGNMDIESDNDDILVKREKTVEEKKKDEADFYEWLKDQKDEELPEKSELVNLKKAWNNPNLDEDEKFLRDYLLNKDYEPETDKDVIPAYEDIVNLEEDEQVFEKQTEYEHKFNFRFEDPDQEFIKQYPRTVNESLRKENTKRKEKREEYTKRKAQEKQEKKQEINKLKKQKRSAIEKKLEKLKRLAGEDISISMADLKGDFDPKEYDRRMQELFNDDYYGHDDKMDEDGKPIFSDAEGNEDSEASDYDNMEISTAPLPEKPKGKKLKKKKKIALEEVVNPEETNGNSAEHSTETDGEVGKKDGDEEGKEVLYRGKESQRKRRRVSKLAAAVQNKKPIFDPNEKTFEEYFNEYYALEYEDIIGDQMTRFKYRQVVPNNFGLDVAEILEADDKQLNAWASLKKATSYRSQEEEKYDLLAYQKKAADIERKKKILAVDETRLKSENSAENAVNENGDAPSKKRKRKPKSKKKSAAKSGNPVSEERTENGLDQPSGPVSEQPVTNSVEPKKKRNRKRKATGAVSTENEEKAIEPTAAPPEEKKPKKKVFKPKKDPVKRLGVDDDRLKAYGLNPKKFKAKLKYGQKKEKDQPVLTGGNA